MIAQSTASSPSPSDPNDSIRGASFFSSLCDDPFGVDPPPRDALLTRRGPFGDAVPYMPAGETAILAGEPGAGKTHLACALALSVASGWPFLGTFDVPTAGAVALFCAEERREEILRRMYAASLAAGLDRKTRELAASRIIPFSLSGHDAAFLAKDASQNLVDTPTLVELRAKIAATGVPFRLVIVDPFINVTCGEENDNTAQRRAMTACASLANVPGSPTVVVVHHTRKREFTGESDGYVGMHEVRGAGSIVGAARFVITLGVIREKAPLGGFRDCGVRLQCVKSNYFALGPHLFLSRCEGGALRPMTGQEKLYAGVTCEPVDDAREGTV